MQQPESLQLVAEFHRTFKHPVLAEPSIPDEKRCKLRVDCWRRKLKSFEEAIRAKDMVGIADALCDIQYVLSGAILEFGLGEKFKALLKRCSGHIWARHVPLKRKQSITVQYYKTKDGTACYTGGNNRWLVYRASDNKTIKSIQLLSADLGRILNAQSPNSWPNSEDSDIL